MKRLSLLSLMILLVCMTIGAQIKGNNITVTVQPDHSDWNYHVGQTAQFTVSVLKSGTPLANAQVDYEAGPVMYPSIYKKGVTLKDGVIHLTGKLTRPGFYRLKVTAHVDGKDYDGLCTAAFNPEKIVPATQCPEDFDDFWNKALKQARQYDLDPHLTPLPDRSTKDVNVYEVSFVNDRPGGRIFGILSVPVKPGKYPALLRVPGAGVRPYSGDVYTASRGAITLEIGIHGLPVTLPQHVYDEIFRGGLSTTQTRTTISVSSSVPCAASTTLPHCLSGTASTSA